MLQYLTRLAVHKELTSLRKTEARELALAYLSFYEFNSVKSLSRILDKEEDAIYRLPAIRFGDPLSDMLKKR